MDFIAGLNASILELNNRCKQFLNEKIVIVKKKPKLNNVTFKKLKLDPNLA